MNDVILSALYCFFKKISFSSKFHAEIPVEDISLPDPELRFACNGETNYNPCKAGSGHRNPISGVLKFLVLL